MYIYTEIEFLGKSSNHLGLDVNDFSVLRKLRLKICTVENVEDMVGVVSEVDFVVLTCNC